MTAGKHVEEWNEVENDRRIDEDLVGGDYPTIFDLAQQEDYGGKHRLHED